MSRVVPGRDARRTRSETYRETAEREVRLAPPRAVMWEWGRRSVQVSAYEDGLRAGELGLKKNPWRAGVPSWAAAEWIAGYVKGKESTSGACSPQDSDS